MSIAKTREQLAMLGVLLLGPIVPEWFKRQSDGGSVPLGWFGRWVFNERQWRVAAYIHDYWYYLIALLWDPEEDEPDFAGARLKADLGLKVNRKLVAKHRAIGWVWSRIIFLGVRAGGWIAMRPASELVVPPTLGEIGEVEACIVELRLPITGQARDRMAKWRVEKEDGKAN